MTALPSMSPEKTPNFLYISDTADASGPGDDSGPSRLIGKGQRTAELPERIELSTFSLRVKCSTD